MTASASNIIDIEIDCSPFGTVKGRITSLQMSFQDLHRFISEHTRYGGTLRLVSHHDDRVPQTLQKLHMQWSTTGYQFISSSANPPRYPSYLELEFLASPLPSNYAAFSGRSYRLGDDDTMHGAFLGRKRTLGDTALDLLAVEFEGFTVPPEGLGMLPVMRFSGRVPIQTTPGNVRVMFFYERKDLTNKPLTSATILTFLQSGPQIVLESVNLRYPQLLMNAGQLPLTPDDVLMALKITGALNKYAISSISHLTDEEIKVKVHVALEPGNSIYRVMHHDPSKKEYVMDFLEPNPYFHGSSFQIRFFDTGGADLMFWRKRDQHEREKNAKCNLMGTWCISNFVSRPSNWGPMLYLLTLVLPDVNKEEFF